MEVSWEVVVRAGIRELLQPTSYSNSPMRRVAVTADLAVVRVTRLAHVAPRDAAALRAGGPGEARDNLRPDSKGEPANISELLPHTVSAAVQKGVLECSPVEVLSDEHLRHFIDRLRVHSGVP